MDEPPIAGSPVCVPPIDEPPIGDGGIDEDVPPDAAIALGSPVVIVELPPDGPEPPEPFMSALIGVGSS
jgi:hypothetical protein